MRKTYDKAKKVYILIGIALILSVFLSLSLFSQIDNNKANSLTTAGLNSATVVGGGADLWTGDATSGNINSAVFNDLIYKIFGENNANSYINTNGKAYYGSTVLQSNYINANIHTDTGTLNNSRFGLVVTLGGLQWIVASVTRDNTDDANIVCTLFLATAKTATVLGASTPNTIGYNAYCNVLTRKVLLTDSYWSLFQHTTENDFAELYLVQPKYVSYQLTQNFANFKVLANSNLTSTNGSDALSTPSGGVVWSPTGSYSGVTPSTTYNLHGYFETEQRYDAWGEDYIWLPSIGEVGLAQYAAAGTGSYSEYIWGITNDQRSFTSTTAIPYYVLRSSAYLSYDYMYVIGPDGKYTYGKLTNSYGLRPALHLNLGSAMPIQELPTPEDVTLEYAGKELDLDYANAQGKADWYTGDLADSDIVKVEYLDTDGTPFPSGSYPKNAGKYTVKFTIQDNSGCLWENDGDNPQTINFEITPKELTATLTVDTSKSPPTASYTVSGLCSSDSGLASTILKLTYDSASTSPPTSSGAHTAKVEIDTTVTGSANYKMTPVTQSYEIEEDEDEDDPTDPTNPDDTDDSDNSDDPNNPSGGGGGSGTGSGDGGDTDDPNNPSGGGGGSGSGSGDGEDPDDPNNPSGGGGGTGSGSGDGEDPDDPNNPSGGTGSGGGGTGSGGSGDGTGDGSGSGSGSGGGSGTGTGGGSGTGSNGNPNDIDHANDDFDIKGEAGEFVNKVKGFLQKFWQPIVCAICAILIICFTSKGIYYHRKRSKVKKEIRKYEEATVYGFIFASSSGTLWGLDYNTWSTLAFTLIGVAVLSFIYMLLEKHGYKKSLSELEDAKIRFASKPIIAPTAVGATAGAGAGNAGGGGSTTTIITAQPYPTEDSKASRKKDREIERLEEELRRRNEEDSKSSKKRDKEIERLEEELRKREEELKRRDDRKSDREMESFKEELRRQAEENRRQNEEMKMMFMSMLGNQNQPQYVPHDDGASNNANPQYGASAGAPYGYAPYGAPYAPYGMPYGAPYPQMGGTNITVDAEHIRTAITETISALMPSMQAMLPQQAGVSDEVVKLLSEEIKSTKEEIKVAKDESRRIAEQSRKSDERMEMLIAKLLEKDASPAVVTAPANDKVLEQLAKNQELLVKQIQDLKSQSAEPKVIEKVVEKPVEKVVEKIVEKPVEKIIEKKVEVPVEKIVEVPITVEKLVEVPVVKEVPIHAPAGKSTKADKKSAPLAEKAPRLTIDEAYALLSKEQKKFFDKLREYALSKEKCKEKKQTYSIVLGQSTVNPLIKLTIKKDTTVALFKMEDEYLKDIRRSAGSDGTKVKVKETEVIVADQLAFDTAKQMIDLREDQIDRYNEYLKEQKLYKK